MVKKAATLKVRASRPPADECIHDRGLKRRQAHRLTSARSMSVRKSVPVHLHDGQEFTNPLDKLLKFGKSLFMANWTIDEGAENSALWFSS